MKLLLDESVPQKLRLRARWAPPRRRKPDRQLRPLVGGRNSFDVGDREDVDFRAVVVEFQSEGG